MRNTEFVNLNKFIEAIVKNALDKTASQSNRTFSDFSIFFGVGLNTL